MRAPMRLGVVAILTLGTTVSLVGQITSNPLPAPIEKGTLAVQIRDLVRLPDTRGLRPAGSGRVAGRMGAGQLRARSARRPPIRQRLARLPVSASTRTTSRTSMRTSPTRFRCAIYNRLESGFIAFAFHPEFARNGLFYTVHAERGPGNPKKPNFIPPGYTLADVTYHNIITEWHATNPGGQHVRGNATRALARSARRHEPHASDGRGGVQSHGKAGRRRLRPALHERQRPRLQQRWWAEREQSRPDAAARLDHDRDPAHRSAQSVGHAWSERAWRLHRSRWRTSSRRMAIRKRSARSTRMASGMPTGSRGTSPTGRCSPRTSA